MGIHQTKNCLLIPFVERDLYQIVFWHFICTVEALHAKSNLHAGNLLIVGYDALTEGVIDTDANTENWPREAIQVAGVAHQKLREKHLDKLASFAMTLACDRQHYESERAAKMLLEFCLEATEELYSVCSAAGTGVMLRLKRHKKSEEGP